MPLNILKKYNQLLELSSLNKFQRKESLMRIFKRDIEDNDNFKFEDKAIHPTPADGKIEMSTLYTHLTTTITDKKTNKREFDIHRSQRLHWIKYHIDKKKKEDMLFFSVKEPNGFRTYIYDKLEKYVIVLEPLRKVNEYYLLTAYNLRGKDAQKNKILKKYKRKLDKIL